ncbi:MAG: phytochelatin synthase family protein [Deltaproteobacteria bacterium]|nr:phytochelatin synthase family protein [Deltaproteobacteria bacterium]
MKRTLRVASIGFAILLLVAAAGVWHMAFRTPPVDLLPLPEDLVAIETAPGQQLLAESRFTADHASLAGSFVSQSRRGFCGVATSVAVLNALRRPEPPITQSTFFTDAAREVRGPLQVSLGGMTLGQLGDLLRAHGLDVTVYYASETGILSFRSVARENLTTSGDYLLVNYQRAELGQGETGHISPVAAYHAATDRFLILDAAAYKYPPVWVGAEALWRAMNTIDPSSSRSRGFVVVREGIS